MSNQANSILLCEFPKSGITFFSNLLISYDLQKSNHKISQPNIFNIQSFISDIDLGHSKTDFLFLDHYNLYKSHNKNPKDYYHCIYIYRNPFEVMLSFYNYKKNKELNYKKNLSAFIRDKNFGISSWVAHANGWTKEITNKKILFVEYGELVTDTKTVIKNILEVLGHQVDLQILDNAVKSSSISSMRNKSEQYLKINKNEKFQFIKPGLDESVSIDDINYINEFLEKSHQTLFTDIQINKMYREIVKKYD